MSNQVYDLSVVCICFFEIVNLTSRFQYSIFGYEATDTTMAKRAIQMTPIFQYSIFGYEATDTMEATRAFKMISIFQYSIFGYSHIQYSIINIQYSNIN